MQFLLIGCCPLLDLRLSLLHNGTKIESHLPKTTLYFIFHIKELVKKATTVVASFDSVHFLRYLRNFYYLNKTVSGECKMD